MLAKSFFFRKMFVCVQYKIRFAVEKKTKKILGQIFKITLYDWHQKNASHTNSIHGNCMVSISPIVWNFMIMIFVVWSCIISIFGVWR